MSVEMCGVSAVVSESSYPSASRATNSALPCTSALCHAFLRRTHLVTHNHVPVAYVFLVEQIYTGM